MKNDARPALLAGAALFALAAGLAAACAAPRGAASLDEQVAIARGGRLYDNWYAEIGAPAPDARHPLYPAEAGYASRPGATWRCKECHGWDYLGRDGAYAQGKHATGVAGIFSMAGADPEAIARVLAAEPHGYAGRMSDSDLRDVALFVSRGQVDMDAVIDRATSAVRGDEGRGRAHFATLCAGCHGAEGRREEMPVLGRVARENPWEVLHKVLNGQPNCAMPALRTLDRDVALDVARFTQTLPDGE